MYSARLSSNNMSRNSQDNLRVKTPINIKLDKDTVVTTSLEEIKESLERSFYENLGLGINRK